jgi:hypothetical protein
MMTYSNRMHSTNYYSMFSTKLTCTKAVFVAVVVTKSGIKVEKVDGGEYAPDKFPIPDCLTGQTRTL